MISANIWIQNRILKYFLLSREDRRKKDEEVSLDTAFKVLICLGDSKGQIHMNNLWLN